MAVPLYDSQARTPQASGFELGTTPQVVTSGGEAVGGALTQAGNVMIAISARMREAREQTEVATATTDFLVNMHDAEKDGIKSTDFRGAPQTFREFSQQQIAEATGKISDPVKRAQLQTRLTSHALSALGRVERTALAREADVNVTALNHSETTAQREVIAATTPVEREAAVARYRQSVAGAVASGWISSQAAHVRVTNFNINVDRSAIAEGLRTDPEGTRKALDDPNNFRHITDPLVRQQYKTASSNAADQVLIDRIGATAASDPDTAREMIDGIEQPHNRYRAAHTIDTVTRSQEVELERQIKAAASVSRSGDNVIDILKAGYGVDPVAVETFRAEQQSAAARGDRAAIKALHDLSVQEKLQPLVRQAYGMPLVELESSIQNMEARMRAPSAKTSAEEVTALAQFKAVRDEIVKKRESSPIELGAQFGSNTYQLNPLGNPGDESFGGELQRRQALIEGVQARVGGTANVLMEAEKTALKERWAEGTAANRYDIAKAVRLGLPGLEFYVDTMAAITGGDVVAEFAGKAIGQGRTDLAKEILHGQALMKAPGVEKNKPDAVTSVMRTKLGSQVYHDIKEQTAALEAAKALYVARRGNAGVLYETPDEATLAKALEDVTGPIISLNGRKVPAGVIPPEPFENSWQRLDDELLTELGGARDRTGRDVPAESVRQHGVLRPMTVGGTNYAVGRIDPTAPDGFEPYLTGEGGSLVIDMRSVVRPAPPPPPRTELEERSTQKLRRPRDVKLQSMEPIEY